MQIKKVKISNLKPHPKNPNGHPQEQLNELQDSLEQFDQVKNIVVWQNKVIAGCGLLGAASKQRRKEIEVQDVSDWPEEKAIKFMIADNRLSELAIMDDDLLAGLFKDMDNPLDIPGIDEDFLEGFDFNENKETVESDKKDDVETLEPDEIIKKRINKADKIVYQFSGGRDSTLAILKTLELVRDKDPVACYVDTGTEFPDLLYFVHVFCKKHDLPLQVLHPRRSFFDLYEKKESFPDPVFRDCIQTLINNPIDDIFFSFNNALILRGGRKKQKTSRSKSNTYQEIIKSKNKTIRLLNPLYAVSDDEYNKDIANINIWPGYDKGFLRTACWCCPFQRSPQWEALKENYPLLWNAMREMAKSWEFKKIKSDGCIKQFNAYWDMQ